MKTDQNGCSTTAAGQEQYEYYYYRGRPYLQYDYRTPDGELFSTIADTLDDCRAQRDKWLENH